MHPERLDQEMDIPGLYVHIVSTTLPDQSAIFLRNLIPLSIESKMVFIRNRVISIWRAFDNHTVYVYISNISYTVYGARRNIQPVIHTHHGNIDNKYIIYPQSHPTPPDKSITFYET